MSDNQETTRTSQFVAKADAFNEKLEAKIQSLEAKADAFNEKLEAKAQSLDAFNEKLEAKAQSFVEKQDAKHIGKPPIGIFKKIGLWTIFFFGSLLLLAVVLKIHEGDYVVLELVYTSLLGLVMTHQPLEVMFFRPKRLAKKESGE